MRRQTRATDVQLVNAAMNDRSFASAEIAAPTDFVYAGAAGHCRAFESARLDIKASRTSESAEGDGTNSGPQNGFIMMLEKGGRDERDAEQQQEGSNHQQSAAQFLSHEDTLFEK